MSTDNNIFAADTANVQAGGSSFFDDASDAIIKGGSAAVVSGLASIANTGIAAANFFGADVAKIDVHAALDNVDQNWGDYYAQHQGTIDTAGFIATSFIPGSLAIKGLNMVRRGEAAGAFGRALNYTTTAQTKNLEAALQVVASPEGSVFTMMNANYLKALAWGTADNVLQTAAFEIGVAATMKASPMLDGESWSDMSHDIIKNALFGGAFGGTIEGIFMRGITKDAVKLVDAGQRKYDLLGASDKLGLSASDTAYRFIDSALKLPKQIFEDDKVLDFTYRLNGKINSTKLATGELYDRALQKTVTSAYSEMERIVTTKLAVDDTSVGAPLARLALDIMKEGKKSGAADDAIRGRLGEIFFNLNSAETLGTITDVTPTKLHYFNPRAKANLSEFPLSEQPANGQATYKLLVDPQELKLATAGRDAMTASDAWSKGFDLYSKPNGEWTINPKSTSVRASVEPKGYQAILDTRNATIDTTVIPSIADVATKENPLVLAGNTVTSGDKAYRFKLGENVGELMGVDSTYTTARHLWADSLKKIDGEVHSTDYSVLDKMSANKEIVAPDTMIRTSDGVKDWRSYGNFDNFVFENKVADLKAELANSGGKSSIPELAYKYNTTTDWIENAIASKFDVTLKRTADNAPDLTVGFANKLSSYAERDHVLVNYGSRTPEFIQDDFGNAVLRPRFNMQVDNEGNAFLGQSRNDFITGSQAWQYRVKLAQDNLNSAFASVFGSDAGKFMSLTSGEIEQLADRNPTGAGLVSFSNANYGDKLRLWSQETGKQTHLLSEQIANKNLSALQPILAELANGTATSNSAATELTAIVTRIRRSSADFTVLGTDYGLDGAYLVDRALLKGGDAETLVNIKDSILAGGSSGDKAYKIVNDLTADFLRTHQTISDTLNQQRAALAVARGQTSNKAPGTLYVPPVDTTKVKYFAFVRSIEGKVLGDDNVSMLLARSDTELQKLASQVDTASGLEVVFKKDVEKFHKAKGDYDYGRALNDSGVNSQLRSSGRLGDYLPSFDVQSTLEDFVNWHQRQAATLVRDGVSTKYAQQIAEFTRLGEEYTAAQSSQFGLTDKLLNRTLKNPYDDLIKGALDVSKRSEFTLLHQTNEMLDALGTRAYRAIGKNFQKLAADGTAADWEEANAYMGRLGLGTPFKDATAFDIAKTPADRNLLKLGLQKANMILSTGVLRLDFMNSLVNVISTPIMLGTEVGSLRKSIAGDAALSARFNDALQIAVPDGGGLAVPSTTKLIAQAIKNYWGPEKDALIKRFTENGDIKGQAAQFHEMINDLSLTPGLVPSKYAEKVNGWVDKAAKITFNTQAEQFTRFVSADVMRQISEPIVQAGKMSVQEQNAFISVFTNRVQGNYIASQRPILFQGTLGSAVGLFQTYQFNLLQQLFRHIENRDMKSVAVMGGLQTSIYGLNGLPLFNAINTNLIGNASINAGHHDAYSYTTQAAGAWGDWLMYGTASALPIFGGKGPALYTRGDIQPRNITVIPVNPADIPAVSATTAFVKNIVGTFSKIANGGAIVPSILEGLEHNVINRPLAGLAQVVNGYSTTGQGSLVSSNQDLFSIGNASRILGAKPLDEAVGMNTKFRLLAYQAEDKARLESLGSAIKTTLRNNQVPSDEQMTDFMGKYAASGGQIQNFGGAMQRWSKDANTSVLNQLAAKVRSPYGQRFVEVMGGKSIGDFSNTPAPDPTLP